MNRCQTGKPGGSPSASSLQQPHPWPQPSPKPVFKTLLRSEAPTYWLLHPSAAPAHHLGGTFSKLFPHNGHTRGLPPSTVTLFGSPFLLSLRPGLGFPSHNHPSQPGTHPKASRLELTGGKGGVAAAAGEHSRGGGVMVPCPSRFSIDLNHCAKPNLPGTKMVGRKL